MQATLFKAYTEEVMARTYVYILARKYTHSLTVKQSNCLYTSIRFSRANNFNANGFPIERIDDLVYYEEYRDRLTANTRCKALRATDEPTLQKMVETLNPHWNDLWPQISISNRFGDKALRLYQKTWAAKDKSYRIE
ncbi:MULTISPECIES: hypothetical protein [unclassified Oleiphilus]|uniref:hypothetical protein n=1 Tax=unclassified Oleiphilus TaxID=2631174 RepID=UPI0007C344D8|nr:MULTISPECIES: hypothetical protein [unclassified Oleiphilus]KZY65142.1 hypothetical protein A3738_09105 [Oleiphilus sp. HI0066]